VLATLIPAPPPGDDWTATVRRQFAGSSPASEYGAAIACADVDSDGWPEICIGSPGEAGPGDLGPDTGAVHVLDGKTLEERLVLHGAAAGERFGHALALTDWNRDSTPDLVVGAPGHADGKGALYVVTDLRDRDEDRAPLSPLLTGQRAGDRLGWSVANAPPKGGGMELQGVLAGAPGHDDKFGDDCGRALFLVSGGKKKPPKVLAEWVGQTPFAELGRFVDCSLYVTAKLERMLLIGAPGATARPFRDLPRAQHGQPLPSEDAPIEDVGLLLVFDGRGDELFSLRGEAAGERFGESATTVRLHGEGVQYGEILAGGHGLARLHSREDGSRLSALPPEPGEPGFGLVVADIGQISTEYQFAFAVATLPPEAGAGPADGTAAATPPAFTGVRVYSGADRSVIARLERPADERYGFALRRWRPDKGFVSALLVGAPGRDRRRGAVELIDIAPAER